MDLTNYAVTQEGPHFRVTHEPTGTTLLVTQYMSLDTLLRIAVIDHAQRNNISLARLNLNLRREGE